MMKHGFHILLTAVAMTVCGLAQAQHFNPVHRHSLEISTGIPPLHTSLLMASRNAEVRNGFEQQELIRPSLNIAYAFSLSEKLSLHLIVNGSMCQVRISQYPKVSDNQYDYSAAPEVHKEWKGPAIAVMGDVRWKWLRTDVLQLYSALGFGILPGLGLTVPVTPYVTPVGINIGRNRVYGIAELTMSSAASFVLGGIGFRF